MWHMDVYTQRLDLNCNTKDVTFFFKKNSLQSPRTCVSLIQLADQVNIFGHLMVSSAEFEILVSIV